jgi:hypothetical protein
MKTVVLLFIACFFCFSSCQKADDIPLTYPDNIVGIYSGLISGSYNGSQYSDSVTTIEVKVSQSNDLELILPNCYSYIPRIEVRESSYTFYFEEHSNGGFCSLDEERTLVFTLNDNKLNYQVSHSSAAWGAGGSGSTNYNFVFEGTKE